MAPQFINSIIKDYINTYASKFIEGIETDQFNWGYTDSFQFKNLKIRETVLEDLNLPLQIAYGFIGELILRIPYLSFWYKPCELDIKDLYLVITPKMATAYDAEKEEKVSFDHKQMKFKQLDEAQPKDLDDEADQGFIEKLKTKILNNIQIEINCIHLRYEDTSSSDKPLAYGCTLYNFSTYTTDGNWLKSFAPDLGSFHKLVKLDSFTTYIDTKAGIYSKAKPQDLQSILRDSITRKGIRADPNSVIGPICFLAKFKINMRPEFDQPPFKIPKIQSYLEMENFDINLTQSQYQETLKVSDGLTRMKLSEPYLKYRPFNLPYKNNAKEWWKYAINSVLEGNIRNNHKHWQWSNIRNIRNLCREYAKVYKEKEMTPKPQPWLIQKCEELEHQLNTFNLILIRQQVKIEVRRLKLQKREELKNRTWLGGWFGARVTDGSFIKRIQEELTEEEKDEIYKAIGFEENATPFDYPKSYESTVLNFNLFGLQVGLYDDAARANIVLLKLSKIELNFIERPGDSSIRVHLAVKEVTLSGLQSNQGIPPPNLIETKYARNQHLLNFVFETNPLQGKCDRQIKLIAYPLQIVYDSDTILRLKEFFTPPKFINTSGIQETATEKMSRFKKRSVIGIQYAIENRSQTEVDIKLMPNIIILPYGGKYDPGRCSIIVLTFGQLHITSRPHEGRISDWDALWEKTADREDVWKITFEKAYDKFNIQLTKIQLITVHPREPWETVIYSASLSEMHILSPVTLNVTIELCIFHDDPRLAKTKVDISIPEIKISLTENRLMQALEILTSLPKFETNEPESTLITKTVRSATSLISVGSIIMEATKTTEKQLEDNVDTQLTDLELNFALNEFSMQIYKFKCRQRNDKSSSHSSGDEDEECAFFTPPNLSSLDVNTDMQAFFENMEKSSHALLDKRITLQNIDERVDKIISFKILQIETNVVQRTFEMIAESKLAAISFQQFGNYQETGDMVYIINTPSYSQNMEHLLTVSYTAVNERSPEFITKYNSTERIIVVNFSVIRVTLHQEYLLKLLELQSKIKNKFDVMNGKNEPVVPQDHKRFNTTAHTTAEMKIPASAEEDAEESEKQLTAPKKRRSNRKGDHIIKSYIVANLEKIAVVMTCRQREITSMDIENFDASVVTKLSYTEIKVHLKNMHVNDSNPKTIHPNFLSIVGSDALICDVVLYNTEGTSDNLDDMKINVEVGCFRIIYLNWFVHSVLRFLGNFKAAQNAIANAGAVAADVAKETAIDAVENSKRMHLNAKLKAPVIVVPVESNSNTAIVIDLGLLKAKNSILALDMKHERYGPALMDAILVDISSIKIYKCIIRNTIVDGQRLSMIESQEEEIDKAFGMKSDILSSVHFMLTLTRNLSAKWYHNAPEVDISGKLKSIEFNLLMDDYALIMSILNHNLTEGSDEFPEIEKQRKSIINADLPKSATPSIQNIPNISSNKSFVSGGLRKRSARSVHKIDILEALRFNLEFDGIVLNLILSNKEGLACFGIYFMSLRGNKLLDETLKVELVLCNIQINDTRNVTSSGITKYLCRKERQGSQMNVVSPNVPSAEAHERCDKENYMLDLNAAIKKSEIFVELRISGFDLIFSVEYLIKLATFFKLPEDAMPAERTTPKIEHHNKTEHTKAHLTEINEEEKKLLQIVLYIAEPDVILVESLDDINTNAIIFNVHAKFNYRDINGHQEIDGDIEDLKMFMCSFKPNHRNSTLHYIIHPCGIALHATTPENEGLRLNLRFSNIIVNVSPATLELLSKVMSTFLGDGDKKDMPSAKVDEDYSHLWGPQTLEDKDHWFIKDIDDNTLDVIETSELTTVQALKNEKCDLFMPSLKLVVEMGVGYYTTPLLTLQIKLNANVRDWSHDMNIKGKLCLSMDYYNQELDVWEPVIEFNERLLGNTLKEYLPWELYFNLQLEKTKNEFDESVEETKNISLHTKENLELTVSRTFLKMLGILGEAFAKAVDLKKGLIKPTINAPYCVENDTGFNISLNFHRGIFMLHNCHMPNAGTRASCTVGPSIVFNSYGSEINATPDWVEDCVVTAGGRVYLQTKSLPMDQSSLDMSIFLKVHNIDREIALPVSKSDKRYFSLRTDQNENHWGFISEVTSEFGTKKINIHGIVNIQNHFTTKITVMRINPNNGQKILVGEVGPDEVFHVPLYTIYAENKDLFFCMDGYHLSAQGVVWNENLSEPEYKRQIQCDPFKTFEPLYMNAVRKKTEIFFESTNKFEPQSAFYTIHLRPPLYFYNALPINVSVSVAGCSVHYNNIAKPMKENETMDDYLDYGEKFVKAGDILQLPTFRLSSKDTLIQYLEKDWSCTTEIRRDQDELVTWIFSSYDSAARMDIDLKIRLENREESIILTLFSPYWLINKTGKMLSYKTDIESHDILYHPPEYKGPILFSFHEKSFFFKKTATIRMNNGEWSRNIPLDTAGSIGHIACKVNQINYEIGVHNHLTSNSLTKQVTFIPFYIVVNKCDFDIELQERSRPGDPWMKIEADACVPIWPKNDLDHLLVAKVEGQPTVAFNYSNIQSTLLQLSNSKFGGINVDIHASEGATYIAFTKYNPGDAPGLIINHTSYPITYFEKGSIVKNVLEPQQQIYYTWAAPTGSRVLLFGSNLAESGLRCDDVGELCLSNDIQGYWVSFLDGLQRVLLFTELETIARRSETSATFRSITQFIELKIHGIGLSVVNNETSIPILYLGIASSDVIWESKKESKKRFKLMNSVESKHIESQYQAYLLNHSQDLQIEYALNGRYPIDFNQMTLRKNSLRNIRRTFYPGIWLSMKTSQYQKQIHAKIFKIQIDNQLYDCIYPVVLAPIPPPKSLSGSTLKPFVEFSVVERLIPHSTVKQFKYVKMLIQEFHFKVDLRFLNILGTITDSETTDEQAIKSFMVNVEDIERPLQDLMESHTQQAQKNFYDNVHIGPLKVHLSYTLAGTPLTGLVSTLVQGIGVTLTDVNDIIFRLSFFEREYQFYTQQQLNSSIIAHYSEQAMKQFYVLVLGLDVLGNPFGFALGLKKGFEDMFYEPIQGAIQGPGEFAEGLVLGVRSLFNHTVGGAAGMVSKITGAVGKGLAALTFDDEYQKKRRENLNKKPANFQEGIARSGKVLVVGLFDGVTGVVVKPIVGAKEGVAGFFKGLGKGTIGLVTRPTAGVVDFASGSFGAVKRATETDEEVQRLRPPRFMQRDKVVRPYNFDMAMGNKILHEVEKGKYAKKDCLVHCEEIVDMREYVVITSHRIIYVTKNDLFGIWMVKWMYRWYEMVWAKSTKQGVELTLKKNNKEKIREIRIANKMKSYNLTVVIEKTMEIAS